MPKHWLRHTQIKLQVERNITEVHLLHSCVMIDFRLQVECRCAWEKLLLLAGRK